MDAMQARFGSLDQDLQDFLAEMLSYKKDANFQLGDQYARLDELKAGAQTLTDALSSLKQDYESWRAQFIANDKGHDSQIGTLSTKANELAGLIQGVRTDVNTALTNVSVLGAANKRQDERMDRMEARDQEIEKVNTNQDSAMEAIHRRLDGLTEAVKVLNDSNARIGQAVADLAADVSALEPEKPELDTPEPTA